MSIQEVCQGLKTLLLPAMRSEFESLSQVAVNESWTYEEYLLELVQVELASRRTKRIQRYLQNSNLPMSKRLSTFDTTRLSKDLYHRIKPLLEGHFIGYKENVLLFGTPGSGKTHLMCALAHEMIQKGYRVYYRVCASLLQDLLLAKRELRLNRLLKKLVSFDLLVIDEIGYIEQKKEEMEVLFTLFGECYESTSVMLTSNLPFSKWETIFKDSMMAAAAIDRLVHHSVILEMNLPSFRLEGKKKGTANPKKQEGGDEDKYQDHA